MEVVAVLAGVAFAINKTVSVIKALTASDWRAALTQVLVWVVGWAALLLMSQATLVNNLTVPGFEVAFVNLDVASLLLLSWVLGSSGSFAFDIKKAIDSTDSAQEASLGGDPVSKAPSP